MSEDFKYKRKFIILKDEMTNITGIKPKGYVRIEVRGNRSYILLNVDNGESNQVYKFFLIGKRNDKIVEAYLGRIFTNEKGKGQIKVDFNSRDIGNTRLSLENFTALVIRRNLNILLSGYIDQNDGLLAKYIVELQNEKEVETETEVVEEIESDKGDSTEEIEEREDLKKLEELVPEELKEEETMEEIKEEIMEEIEEEKIEEIIEETEDDIKDFTNTEEIPKYNYENIDYIRKMDYKSRLNNYVMSILKFFPYVDPFCVQLKGYDWWRIEYDGTHSYRGFLPFSSYLMNMSYNYPFVSNTISPISLMKKYNHYIFGMYKEYEDVIYYLYGIPGQFISAEHPYKGISGFNTWFEGKEGYGYWLIYIEPITGKVAFPLNPMVPFN